jgi:hypothetical protein
VLNKKECLKHSNPNIKFSRNSGVLHYGKIEYIVCAATKNIAGRRTLILYLYNREKLIKGYDMPEYTLFQCRNDFILLQKDDNGKLKWRVANLDKLEEMYDGFTSNCAFYRLSDEQHVVKFCGIPDKGGFPALNTLQAAIKNVKHTKCVKEKEKEREKNIIERMSVVPATPRGLKNWVIRDILPHYIFYEYTRGSNTMKGFCTFCRRDVLVSGARHCIKGKCPKCKKSIDFWANGRAKRVWDRATVQVLQKVSDDEMVLRIYKVNCLRNYREPYFECVENARVFIRVGELYELTTEQYYYSNGGSISTGWKKGERPKFMHRQTFESDMNGYLYIKNLSADLKGTNWQYSQLEQYYSTDCEPLEVIPYFRSYDKYPAIEYLVKLGLTNLAKSVVYERDGAIAINENGTNIRETLGIEPDELTLMQKINANGEQLILYRKLKRQGVIAGENLLNWYKEHKIKSSENILVPLKYTTPHKLMRYIEEQFENLKSLKLKYGGWRYGSIDKVLSEYKDYLYMGALLEFDFKSCCALFPKHLSEAHDNTSELFKSKKGGLNSKAISDAYEILMTKYHFSKGGLTLVPPKTDKEIVHEGHSLHHCVHSYVGRVAKGECLILFVRQKEKPDEPFYTLEIRNDRVVQIHGKNHCAPTPDVKEFVALWQRKRLWAAA